MIPQDASADVNGGGWATGGTKSMTGNYPDPFATGVGNVCMLTCSAILGPCYARTLERKDISEGHDGLPVRLSLLILDEACKPLPGVSIDIWHAGPNGIYSGDDSAANCNFNDTEALASRWFRGVQTTNESGRADFDTCFPGWYAGRTIHIHVTLRKGDVEYLTTQLFFDDLLCDDITTTQPLYKERGMRDTTNASDAFITPVAAPDYSFRTARMADGAMLASKAIFLRNVPTAPLCSTPGNSDGGGFPPFDGLPPDGFPGLPPAEPANANETA
jgi:protocatechuate 3,4-dioxygenase beta subunit